MKATADLDLMTLGGQITWRRQCAGWTLRDLAQRASVSAGFLSEIENGKAKNPGVYTVQKIALALGVGVTSLIGVPRVPEPAAEQTP